MGLQDSAGSDWCGPWDFTGAAGAVSSTALSGTLLKQYHYYLEHDQTMYDNENR